MKLLTPQNERERLQVLRQYQILDTPAEERFDTLVRQAAEKFGTPIALFSVIDADRQWFKSRVGLNIEEATRVESFCGHVIATNAPLVVEDTSSDVTFATSPFVVGYPKIAFYAGVPIRAANGMPLGTLCIIDRSPRSFPWHQFLELQEMGRLIELQLEKRATEEKVLKH